MSRDKPISEQENVNDLNQILREQEQLLNWPIEYINYQETIFDVNDEPHVVGILTYRYPNQSEESRQVIGREQARWVVYIDGKHANAGPI